MAEFNTLDLGAVLATGDAIKARRYNNALLQESVNAMPQRQRMTDLEERQMQQEYDQRQQALSDQQMKNARGIFGQYSSAIAQSDRPREFYQRALSDRTFMQAANMLGFGPDQLVIGPNDTDDSIRQQATDMARALGMETSRRDGPKYGVTPQFGIDAEGNPVPIQFTDTGEASVTALPDGVRISREPIRMDLGTEWAILDPITRQVVSRQPKNIEGENSQKQIGESYGKAYSEIQTAGLNAGQSLARLNRLEGLLSQIETGKLAGAKQTISEYAQAFGVDVEGLDETQAFQALTNQLALEMRNPSGGAGMPGAMSDKDREFLLRMVPNILNTPGGNRQIIAFARALAQRNQQVAARAREYKRRTGGMDDQFFEELAQWSESAPLFDQGKQGPGGRDINQLLDKYAPR